MFCDKTAGVILFGLFLRLLLPLSSYPRLNIIAHLFLSNTSRENITRDLSSLLSRLISVSPMTRFTSLVKNDSKVRISFVYSSLMVLRLSRLICIPSNSMSVNKSHISFVSVSVAFNLFGILSSCASNNSFVTCTSASPYSFTIGHGIFSNDILSCRYFSVRSVFFGDSAYLSQHFFKDSGTLLPPFIKYSAIIVSYTSPV